MQSERAASLTKGIAACAALEAVTQAHDWHEEAKRLYNQQFADAADAEETYHDIMRTL